jgi:hypothetical protein
LRSTPPISMPISSTSGDLAVVLEWLYEKPGWKQFCSLFCSLLCVYLIVLLLNYDNYDMMRSGLNDYRCHFREKIKNGSRSKMTSVTTFSCTQQHYISLSTMKRTLLYMMNRGAFFTAFAALSFFHSPVDGHGYCKVRNGCSISSIISKHQPRVQSLSSILWH